MSIYLTGDIHGEMSITRLSCKIWPQGKDLTSEDYLIVAGDFGLLFHPEPTQTEKYWLKWLENKPWTTLFVDGNHENHDMLNQLPVKEKFGGKVGVVSDSIYHLKRGEIYQIQDKKILAFGGAESIDKLSRIENVSWWKEEIPSYAEMDTCLENLKKHNYKVDYIVAHTCPRRLFESLVLCKPLYGEVDPTTKMLEHIVTITKFDSYYCGHWHMDVDAFEIYHFVYKRILQIA